MGILDVPASVRLQEQVREQHEALAESLRKEARSRLREALEPVFERVIDEALESLKLHAESVYDADRFLNRTKIVVEHIR